MTLAEHLSDWVPAKQSLEALEGHIVRLKGACDDGDRDDMAGNRGDDSVPVAVLTYIARSLADEPDSVVVEAEKRRGSVVLRVHVAPEDMGRVIGRRGRTAQAIRTLVGAAGARDGTQVSVDIVDD